MKNKALPFFILAFIFLVLMTVHIFKTKQVEQIQPTPQEQTKPVQTPAPVEVIKEVFPEELGNAHFFIKEKDDILLLYILYKGELYHIGQLKR